MLSHSAKGEKEFICLFPPSLCTKPVMSTANFIYEDLFLIGNSRKGATSLRDT